jgi:hypothetical protein
MWRDADHCPEALWGCVESNIAIIIDSHVTGESSGKRIGRGVCRGAKKLAVDCAGRETGQAKPGDERAPITGRATVNDEQRKKNLLAACQNSPRLYARDHHAIEHE